MKYGILWRTKGLARMLVNKVELNLGKAVLTTSLWAAKNPTEYGLSRRMIDLIDQAKDLTDYGINMLTGKVICTDKLVSYNLVNRRLGKLASEMNLVTLEIKEYNSNKEGA